MSNLTGKDFFTSIKSGIAEIDALDGENKDEILDLMKDVLRRIDQLIWYEVHPAVEDDEL